VTYKRENLEALIEDRFDVRVRNPYVQNNRLIYLLGLHNPAMLDKVGHPGEAVLLGGMGNLSHADITHAVGAASYQTRFRVRALSSGSSVEEGGATPVADRFAEDDYGTAEWRYWFYGQGFRIRASTLRHAGSEGAIRQIVDQTMGDYAEQRLKDLQTMMWRGGTGANGSTVDMNTTVQQNKRQWREPLGLVYSVGTQNNLLGTVNRTDAPTLNSFVINAATAFPGAVANLEMIRWVNNGFVSVATGLHVDGAARHNPNGVGCKIVITTPHIFNRLMTEAESRGYKVYSGDMPDMPKIGFKGRVIEFEGVYITDDPDCPTGTMYFLDPERIQVHIEPTKNFSKTPLVLKSDSEEGGEDYEWCRLDIELRLVMSDVYLMGTVTNVLGA
jgi:hypothetical protein